MKINTYYVVERALYEGITFGVAEVLKNKEVQESPEKIIDTIHKVAMNELSGVIQFDEQPVELTEEVVAFLKEMEGHTDEPA